jgi:hypothetical protein
MYSHKDAVLYVAGMFMKKPQCSSDDQEEMMDCLPVQCTAKYSGTRNYFNVSSQMCDKPVSCHSDHKFPLPTKALCLLLSSHLIIIFFTY